MLWCLNALPNYFFLHIFEVKVSNFYWPATWEIWQKKLELNLWRQENWNNEYMYSSFIDTKNSWVSPLSYKSNSKTILP